MSEFLISFSALAAASTETQETPCVKRSVGVGATTRKIRYLGGVGQALQVYTRANHDRNPFSWLPGPGDGGTGQLPNPDCDRAQRRLGRSAGEDLFRCPLGLAVSVASCDFGFDQSLLADLGSVDVCMVREKHFSHIEAGGDLLRKTPTELTNRRRGG